MADRQRLRELLAEGSARPWRFKLNWPAEGDYYSTWQDSPEDVALITEAVNTLPGLLDALDEAEKALREIEKGEGPFSRDPLTHAENTIEHMKAVAREALARNGDAE